MRDQILLAATLCVMLTATAAAEDEPSVSNDEIFFDVRSGRFSAPLPFGKAVKIAIVEPEGSRVTLHMARVSGHDACDSAALKHDAKAHHLAGAPSGGPLGGKQKFLVTLPKLFPQGQYCFFGEVIRQRALEVSERVHLAHALVRALRTMVKSEIDGQPLHDAQECQRLEAIAAPASVAEGSGRLRPCDIAHQTHQALPRALQQATLYNARLDREMTVKEAIYRVLMGQEGKDFVHMAQREIGDVLVNAALARSNQLPASLAAAKQNTSRYRNTLRSIYSPIFGVDQTALCGTLQSASEPGKGIEKAVCSGDDAAFVAALYARRASLKPINAQIRASALPASAEAQLQGLFALSTAPPHVSAPASTLHIQVGLLEQDSAIDGRVAVVGALLTQLEPFKLGDRSGLPDTAPTLPKLADLGALYRNLVDISDALAKLQKEARIETTVPELAEYKAFVQELSAQRVYVGRTTTAQASLGQTEDLFPFHVTLDVGGAMLTFDDSEDDFAQYFGVNMYFAAVDPGEPLYTNYSPARTLSLTFGLTTTGGKSTGDGRVSGVVGDQFLLVGGGIRLLTFLRLSGGGLLYRARKPNPLRRGTDLKVGYYAGLSLDLDAFTVISSGFNRLTGDDDG